MAQYEKKPAKFYEFANKVGCIKLGEQDFPLCDHVQKIKGTYYATAFYEGDVKPDGKDAHGIYYKKISNADLAFLPEDLLKQAQIKFDDMGQTDDMVARLLKTITELNLQEYTREVA